MDRLYKLFRLEISPKYISQLHADSFLFKLLQKCKQYFSINLPRLASIFPTSVLKVPVNGPKLFTEVEWIKSVFRHILVRVLAALTA